MPRTHTCTHRGIGDRRCASVEGRWKGGSQCARAHSLIHSLTHSLTHSTKSRTWHGLVIRKTPWLSASSSLPANGREGLVCQHACVNVQGREVCGTISFVGVMDKNVNSIAVVHTQIWGTYHNKQNNCKQNNCKQNNCNQKKNECEQNNWTSLKTANCKHANNCK